MVLISNNESLRVFVQDHSYVGTARRAVNNFAARIGLSEQPLHRLTLLVSELATNLAKHASRGGEILINDVSTPEYGKAVQIFSIDRGPGIADLDAAITDGYSSTCTMGAGLGSLKRLSDNFEISSVLGKGTAVVCTIMQDTQKSVAVAQKCLRQKAPRIAYIAAPHPNESQCGDAVSTAVSSELSSLLVVDASGHGEQAALVGMRAASAFQLSPFDEPCTILQRVNSELAGTRGVAFALVQIKHDANKLSFLGVGNIGGNIFTRYTSRGCFSIQGVVGVQMGKPKLHEYEWENNSVLVLYSDGIKSSVKLENFLHKSANLIVAEIYRDYSRLNDDASILVVKRD